MSGETLNTIGWDKISIKQYIQLYDLKFEDELELFINQIALIKGLTISEVENIPFTEIKNLKAELLFLSAEPDHTKIKSEIIIDGVKYKMKENLLDFTLGEWIDLESYNKDFVHNMHRVLSILYKKEGVTSYNPTECDELADLLYEKLDIESALSAFFLFSIFGLNYMNSDIQGFSAFQKAQMNLNGMKEIIKTAKEGLSVQ